MKLDHKAIASISFLVHSCEERTGLDMAEELIGKVQVLLENVASKGELDEGEEKNRLTSIPFFDIIH